MQSTTVLVKIMCNLQNLHKMKTQKELLLNYFRFMWKRASCRGNEGEDFKSNLHVY